jgi:hypothetical protein
MDIARDRLTGRLHLAVALLAAWLIVTSPWIALYRRVPASPGLLNGSHVALGFASLALAVPYLLACTRGGRWRLYFPWLAGQGGAALRDLAGLARGRIPSAEGGGLFAVIEGLTLLSLLAAAATGAAWFFGHGSDGALLWRGYHVVGARILIGMVLTHVVTVSLHLLEFVRD